MKYSGIPWIGSLPDSWQITKVKNCFYISKEKANECNPVVLSLARSGVKIRDISNNEGQLAASYENYNPVKPGDLLLNTMDLYSGANCNVSEVAGVISPAYANLRAKIDLNPKYFDYFFKTQYWSMAMFAHGKGISFDNRWTLNNDGLLNYFLPFPTLNEQNKIVEIIEKKCSEIDALIEIERQQIETLKELKKAEITKCITKGIDKCECKSSGFEWMGDIPEQWEIRRFKNLGECRNGLTYTPSDLCSSKEGILVLRSSNIQNNKLVLNDNAYVSCEIRAELMLKEGDILICSRNGSAKLIGKNVLIPSNLKATFGAFIIVYCCDHPEYVRYILSSSIFDHYLGTFLTVSVNQLTGANFMNIMFPYPKSETTRTQIVKFLDKRCSEIDGLIIAKNKKIESLNNYKKSLIFEYITGKKEVAA